MQHLSLRQLNKEYLQHLTELSKFIFRDGALGSVFTGNKFFIKDIHGNFVATLIVSYNTNLLLQLSNVRKGGGVNLWV